MSISCVIHTNVRLNSARRSAEQVDHQCLDADVETGRRLVEHENLRTDGQGPGDRDALELSDAHLAWVAAQVRVVQADVREQLSGTIHGLSPRPCKSVLSQRLRESVENRPPAVERRQRVLRHELNGPPHAPESPPRR